MKAGYGIISSLILASLRGILPLYFLELYFRNIGKIKPLGYNTIPLNRNT